MTLHYDPHYARSQAQHFASWADRQRIESDDLSEQGIERLADTILAMEAAGGSKG